MSGIAVIGMACRVPGARTIDQYWRNLRGGVESIARLSDDDLRTAGVAEELIAHPQYVKAAATLDGIELFDAALFALTPREAEILDVQHRVFLECAWEALEDACCEPNRHPGSIGVYAGAGMNAYLLANLLPQREALALAGGFQALISNDKDFLPTRTSYKLNLRGPSVSVQTACSTSLVAIHLACQALLAGECDVALAGGVSVRVPQRAGYLYEEGMILSPDGHCRAFDAAAAGTVPGSGAGVVVLKRLDEALADGDRIDAVVLGSAINNDGARKVGYTAPSVDGQRAVIAEALAIAAIEPGTIGFVEAHGTGTSLGDPIEFAALRQVFQPVDGAAACLLGSVKTNVGHLDAAAGVAGFIKAVLALRHREVPPTLHFATANPQIDFASTSFRVNTRVEPLPARGATPARAAVSSFGIGGTNAHVVLEAAPAPAPRPAATSAPQVLVLSAATPAALDAHAAAMAAALDAPGSLGLDAVDLDDVAWSLQSGRRAFEHRLAVVASSRLDGAAAFANGTGIRGAARSRSVVFMFPGQGSQAPGMAAGLYPVARVFRESIDECCAALTGALGFDLRELLLAPEATPALVDRITQTSIAQPALFVVEYALARQLLAWGIEPAATIGHSIGEYVAACLAGTLGVADALTLVAGRGRLMQQMPAGRMLAVHVPAAELTALAGPDVFLAAANAPRLCVASGPAAAIADLEQRCQRDGVETQALQTSHAFHSAAMDGMLADFRTLVSTVRLAPPSAPWISNLTGAPITAAQACDPDYWVRHLREPVLFADGLSAALRQSNPLLLEVGPGRALSTLAGGQVGPGGEVPIVAAMAHQRDRSPAPETLMVALARLWVAGVPLRWENIDSPRPRRHVALPTYPFERQRYWIDPPAPSSAAPASGAATDPDAMRAVDDWFHVPVWKSAPAPQASTAPERRTWIVFAQDADTVMKAVMERLQAGGGAVAVTAGREFQRVTETRYTVRPDAAEDYAALLADLQRRGIPCADIVHAWSVDADGRDAAVDRATAGATLDEGFFSLLALGRALADSDEPVVRLRVLSSRMQPAGGEGQLSVLRAALLGPVQVMPRELPAVRCRSIDYCRPADRVAEARLVELLYRELMSAADEPLVAYRDNQRRVRTLEPVALEQRALPFRTERHYLITGGMGGVGLVIARHLARACRARLSLVGRSAAPPDVLRELEAAGGQAWATAADVADLDQLREAVRLARARFGPVDGVIHAAGVAGGGVIPLKTRAEVERVWRPKIDGARNLARVFEGSGLDFMVFMSSLTGVLGEAGQVDYAAASAVLDALAHERRARGERAISIDWDTWRETGMAVNTRLPARLQALRDDALRFGIGNEQGVEVLSRALSSDLAQLVVSTRGPRQRADRAAREADDIIAAAAAAVAPAGHGRPQLAAAFAEPESPQEQALTRLWEQLLGVSPVGIHDDFFELGGHSLVATQLLSRVRDQLGVRVTLAAFFERPTIAALGAVVESRQMEAVLADVDGLTDEDIERQLSSAPGTDEPA